MPTSHAGNGRTRGYLLLFDDARCLEPVDVLNLVAKLLQIRLGVLAEHRRARARFDRRFAEANGITARFVRAEIAVAKLPDHAERLRLRIGIEIGAITDLPARDTRGFEHLQPMGGALF